MKLKQLRFQRGATLIEVAITTLLLATCLLSMAILQKRSLQFNQAAFMRSQANIHAYDITDLIRINRGSASTNIEKYNTSDYDGTPSGNDIAIADVAAWRANIVRSLPGGKGKITCTKSTRICTVSIKWGDEQLFGAGDTANPNPEATTELAYTSVI